jgi:hypothetical protein
MSLSCHSICLQRTYIVQCKHCNKLHRRQFVI